MVGCGSSTRDLLAITFPRANRYGRRLVSFAFFMLLTCPPGRYGLDRYSYALLGVNLTCVTDEKELPATRVASVGGQKGFARNLVQTGIAVSRHCLPDSPAASRLTGSGSFRKAGGENGGRGGPSRNLPKTQSAKALADLADLRQVSSPRMLSSYGRGRWKVGNNEKRRREVSPAAEGVSR